MFYERLTIQNWVPSAFLWVEFWHPGIVGPDFCYTINRTDRVCAASDIEQSTMMWIRESALLIQRSSSRIATTHSGVSAPLAIVWTSG